MPRVNGYIPVLNLTIQRLLDTFKMPPRNESFHWLLRRNLALAFGVHNLPFSEAVIMSLLWMIRVHYNTRGVDISVEEAFNVLRSNPNVFSILGGRI